MYARTEQQKRWQEQGPLWNANADGTMRLGFFSIASKFCKEGERECVLNKALLKRSFHFITVLKTKPQNPKSNLTQPQNKPPHSVSHGPAPLGEFFPLGTEWESCSCLRSWTADVKCCAVHQLVLFWESPCTPTSPFQSPVAWSWVMMCYSITNMSMQPAKQ